MLYFIFCPAVAVNPKLEYVIVKVDSLPEEVSPGGGAKKRKLGNILQEEEKPYLIVASDLVSKLEAKWGVKLAIKRKLLGSDLEKCRLLDIIF